MRKRNGNKETEVGTIFIFYLKIEQDMLHIASTNKFIPNRLLRYFIKLVHIVGLWFVQLKLHHFLQLLEPPYTQWPALPESGGAMEGNLSLHHVD